MMERGGLTASPDDVVVAVTIKLRDGPGAIVVVAARVVVHAVL